MVCLRCSVPSLLQAFGYHTLIDEDGLLAQALVEIAGLRDPGIFVLPVLAPC